MVEDGCGSFHELGTVCFFGVVKLHRREGVRALEHQIPIVGFH